jgi:hypothetical protein
MHWLLSFFLALPWKLKHMWSKQKINQVSFKMIFN